MTIQSNNNSPNYFIDPKFTKVNRLLVFSFEGIEKDNVKKVHRDSVSHHYVPNVKVKDFNVVTDGKSFFDLPVKNVEEAYEKIIRMSRNNDCTTGNLLDFAHFKKHYRLVDPQETRFNGKLENEAHGEPIFFIIKKSEKTTSEFFQNSVNIF